MCASAAVLTVVELAEVDLAEGLNGKNYTECTGSANLSEADFRAPKDLAV
jgi:hypothetical protein